MNTGEGVENSGGQTQNKYKGVRRRRWGKWVSEIRVPGTRDRLWLDSYSTPEAAAVAHDFAFYFLHKPSSLASINFPSLLPPSGINSGSSPRSIQKTASDAGMAIDARVRTTGNQLVENYANSGNIHHHMELEDACFGSWEGSEMKDGEALSISVEDYL